MIKNNEFFSGLFSRTAELLVFTFSSFVPTLPEPLFGHLRFAVQRSYWRPVSSHLSCRLLGRILGPRAAICFAWKKSSAYRVRRSKQYRENSLKRHGGSKYPRDSSTSSSLLRRSASGRNDRHLRQCRLLRAFGICSINSRPQGPSTFPLLARRECLRMTKNFGFYLSEQYCV